MKMEHLSEELIQQIALEGNAGNLAASEHLAGCESCASRVADYKLMFAGISDLQAPVFEFDLAAMVMEKLPALHQTAPASITTDTSEPKRIPWMIAAIVAALALMGLPFYYFSANITNMLSGLSTMITVLAVIMVVLVAIFQVIDEYRKYNKRINSLNI